MEPQPQRKRALVGECISRASVEAARGATVADIDAALAVCDYERAATLAFARAKGGETVGTDVIARILPGIELPAITCSLIAIAPDRAALIEMIEQGRFPRTKDGAEHEALALYAAWKAGADKQRVMPHLRRLSARQLTAEGYALLATIAATIDDPNVVTATKPILPFAKEYAKHVATDDKAMTASLQAVIAELPAEVEASLAAGFTVRASDKAGRNAPCPCGSGLKYKKCCADKPQAAPSPIPGVAWDDFLDAAADKISPEHVDELTLRDLARVNLEKVDVVVLDKIHWRFMLAHEWSHATRVLAEAERRGGEKCEDFIDQHVTNLLDAGHIAEARPHIAKLPDDMKQRYAVELAIADGPEQAYRALVDAVRAALGSTEKIPDVDLAFALLRAEPTLGILAARACIGAMHVDDPDLLLETVEEARDKLNLPPSDPAWDVLEELTADEDGGDRRKSSSNAKGAGDDLLKTQLATSSARIDELERTVAALKRELDVARTRPAAELMRAPEQATGLEAKVRELEGLIREGNAERRELRKQLETHKTAAQDAADERSASPRAHRASAEAADDSDGLDEALEPGTREVSLPRFERRFTDALADVPATVAAETMRTIGTLAAGDGFAWRGVKQAKDMARQVLMARVGIHHRLIFRVEDGAMDVLDLITREQLDTTLKRLRMNR